MEILGQLSNLAGRGILRVSPSRVSKRNGYAKLVEVGRLDKPRIGNYPTGQLFLHRVLCYRGVILFPWTAKIFEHESGHLDQIVEGVGEKRELKGRSLTYYQVLMDSRDYPHIRAQTEAVTFLGSHDGNKNLYAMPGLDYVAHDDMVPYSSIDKHPVHHELVDKFLRLNANREPPFLPTDTLHAWQRKNHPWLILSDVHTEVTENVKVTVIPFYMGSKADKNGAQIFWWRYCVRLENLASKPVHLKERQWCIFSQTGTLETIRGKGVADQEPRLSKDNPAFQYSSHVSLRASRGHMWGLFRMEREDGYIFDCKIPPFSLESKEFENNPNPPSVPSV